MVWLAIANFVAAMQIVTSPSNLPQSSTGRLDVMIVRGAPPSRRKARSCNSDQHRVLDFHANSSKAYSLLRA